MAEDLSQDARTLIAGRYQLLEPIGEGGMARVWRAEDVRLAHPVAIKLLTLHGEGETEEARVHRFLREARIAAAVRHPNVVDVLDFGTREDGRPFMVMELLEGESLEDRLARGPAITLAELVEFTLGVLDGLEAVHRAGVVHRDLKPDNVYLLDDGEGGVRPKLLDFGVSRATDPVEGRRSVLTTMQGRLVGTPEYMSPEQARGHSDVDERTDIYSVGVMVYEALTGRLPYDAPALGDLIISIAMGGAPSVVTLRPDVGVAISDVIERSMEVAREDRWQTAREMREALADAALACLGKDVRRSLPAPALERHGLPAAIGSDLATKPGTPIAVARPANATPQVPVDPVRSLPPPPTRRRWTAVAAVAVVLLAGLGSWAAVRTTSDDALPSAAAPPLVEGPGVEGSGSHARTSEVPTSEPEPAAADPGTPAPSSVAGVVEPAPVEATPEPVRVRLRGVPRRARVLVDGEVIPLEDDGVTIPRDGESHRIVVRRGRARWRVTHVADGDGDYSVRLRRVRRVRSRPAASEADDRALFRELDY